MALLPSDVVSSTAAMACVSPAAWSIAGAVPRPVLGPFPTGEVDGSREGKSAWAILDVIICLIDSQMIHIQIRQYTQ